MSITMMNIQQNTQLNQYNQLINLIQSMDEIEKYNKLNSKGENVNQYFRQFQQLMAKNNKQSQRINEIDEKIQSYIGNGQIIFNKNKRRRQQNNFVSIGQQIRLKKDKFNRQLMNLSISLNKSGYSDDKSLNKNRRINSTRTFTKGSDKIQNEQMIDDHNKQMSTLQRIKQLKKQKELIKKQKQLQQQEKLTKQQIQQKLENERKQKQENKKMAQKLLGIYERMKKLQNDRQKRLKTLQESHIKSSPTLTKYKQLKHEVNAMDQKYYYEKLHKFKQMQFKLRLQSSQQAAKQHAKDYDKYLKQRQSSARVLKQTITLQEVQQRQNNYNKSRVSEQKLQKSIQKSWKVKQYQQKIDESRKIMRLDPKVGIQIEAAKDRAKHPFKYHYLQQKNHLTDTQIYENHRNFNFKQSHIQKGNQYLNQLKIRKNLSQDAIKRRTVRIKTDVNNKLQHLTKPIKDYLQQSKKMIAKKKIDEMDMLMKQYGEKSKVFQILQNRANQHLQNSVNKIADLKKANTYSKTLNIQQEVDQQFISSIKAKIKCLQIK